MTAEQFIAEYQRVYGHMPPREELWHGIESLSQHGAAAALKAYQKAYPEARRAPAGAKSKLSKSDRPAPAPAAHTTEWKETGSTATIEFKAFREIRNIEDLLDAAGVDRDVWTAPTCTVNTWTMPGGADSDEPRIRLWQVKATLKRRSEVADLRRIQAETLAAIAAHAPAYSPIMRPPTNGGHLLLLSPSDAHLGKLAWSAETGQPDQTLESAVQMVHQAIRSLTADALHHGLERICLVIGNDFMQTDGNNDGKTTTASTYVDTAERYWKVFNAARDLLVQEVEWLTQFAPVTILAVQGNHDSVSTLSMGQLLAAWFRNAPDVTVEAGPTSRKYLSYHSVLLGFTHGNEEKHATLPQIMAAEQRAAWATATCREWITGHFHRKQERQFVPLIEEGGVMVRTMPSLSRQDAYHAKHGYLGETAAQALVYSRSSLKASYHYRPEAM